MGQVVGRLRLGGIIARKAAQPVAYLPQRLLALSGILKQPGRT